MFNLSSLLIKIVFCLAAYTLAQKQWYTGRATYYGDEYWLWNIHEGSCGYYYLCPEEGTGWDITALPDVHWDFYGSCGRCYEVKCNPSSFTDNYGQKLDRSHQCYDSAVSVVVTVTDTCPCNYATNSYSNKRWCCGDMDHLDLSVWAFEKLAEKRWGVIGLQYREVPCSFQPAKVAPEVADPTPPSPIPSGTSCPKGTFALKPNQVEVQKERVASSGEGSYANSPSTTYSKIPVPKYNLKPVLVTSSSGAPAPTPVLKPASTRKSEEAEESEVADD
eukprot:TRINITY_DN4933_c0_g2_i3.p1 TRINITY_DN4933_c0_g2~~TRINITY_DN4933_c0_g2_i3.p1  ORF type:complete len:276 (+),score=50.75 TRINITY_DN4933_c0_g2_i3:125-952(+)